MIEPPAPGDDGLPRPPHARPSAWSQPMVFAVIIAAVLLVTGGITAGIVLSEPSYPHSWCGPVLDELHARGGTEGQLLGALSRIQRQDHAPIGGLVADLTTYAVDNQAAQNASNFSVLGALGTAEGDLIGVRLDLVAVNRECGQPASAAGKDNV